MDIGFLFMGIVIGFAIAAPVGPIGILCIRNTLSGGRLIGLVSGLGAATVDLLYACIAGFGVTIISDMLLGHQVWLHMIGGVFLVGLGIHTLIAKPSGQIISGNGDDLVRAYYSTFFLTITNPVTLILFAGIMTGLGMGSMGHDVVSTLMLVFGVFGGSVLWWAMLSMGTGMIQNRMNTGTMQWVNRVSGLIITGFGMASLENWI